MQNHLFATGYQVLFASTISGFRNLYLNGTDSLGTSTLRTQLTTNFNDASTTDSTVRFYIDEANNYSYYVTCTLFK